MKSAILYSSHLLSVILLVLFLGVTGSSLQGEKHTCPPGLLLQFNETTGETTCCHPVYCDRDHFVRVCSVNGTADVCTKCPNGTTLAYKSSSFHSRQCYRKPDCAKVPEMAAVDPRTCECNRENGFYEEPPENTPPPSLKIISIQCQPLVSVCGQGKQPVKDACEECPPGYFKSDNSKFGLCRQAKNCSMLGLKTKAASTARTNTVCEDVVPGFLSPTTALPQPSPQPSSQPSPSTPAINEDKMKEKEGKSYVILIIALVMSVAVIIAVVLWCKRKQIQRWFRGTSGGNTSEDQPLTDIVSDDGNPARGSVKLNGEITNGHSKVSYVVENGNGGGVGVAGMESNASESLLNSSENTTLVTELRSDASYSSRSNSTWSCGKNTGSMEKPQLVKADATDELKIDELKFGVDAANSVMGKGESCGKKLPSSALNGKVSNKSDTRKDGSIFCKNNSRTRQKWVDGNKRSECFEGERTPVTNPSDETSQKCVVGESSSDQTKRLEETSPKLVTDDPCSDQRKLLEETSPKLVIDDPCSDQTNGLEETSPKLVIDEPCSDQMIGSEETSQKYVDHGREHTGQANCPISEQTKPLNRLDKDIECGSNNIDPDATERKSFLCPNNLDSGICPDSFDRTDPLPPDNLSRFSRANGDINAAPPGCETDKNVPRETTKNRPLPERAISQDNSTKPVRIVLPMISQNSTSSQGDGTRLPTPSSAIVIQGFDFRNAVPHSEHNEVAPEPPAEGRQNSVQEHSLVNFRFPTLTSNSLNSDS